MREEGFDGVELHSAHGAAVSVPAIITGGVTRAEDAERLLEQGAADLIGVGRAMLRDSMWAVDALRTQPEV